MACSSGGSNPLEGTWNGTITPQTGVTIGVTLTLAAGGAFSVTGTGTGSCSGTLAYSGFTWTSTDTTLTTSGTASCSGPGITCGGGGPTCGSTGPTPMTCTYQLSNGNNTLALTCPSPNDTFNTTYTRQ